VPYAVPYPYAAPYPAYPAYPPAYSNPYPPAYSNPYPPTYQQPGAYSITPGVTGGISFDIQPSTAEVFVDGQDYGTVANFSPNSQQPLALSPGRHRVEIRQQGYRDISFDVDITAGQVIPYQGTLQTY
jgi:hypothetical protein